MRNARGAPARLATVRMGTRWPWWFLAIAALLVITSPATARASDDPSTEESEGRRTDTPPLGSTLFTIYLAGYWHETTTLTAVKNGATSSSYSSSSWNNWNGDAAIVLEVGQRLGAGAYGTLGFELNPIEGDYALLGPLYAIGLGDHVVVDLAAKLRAGRSVVTTADPSVAPSGWSIGGLAELGFNVLFGPARRKTRWGLALAAQARVHEVHLSAPAGYSLVRGDYTFVSGGLRVGPVFAWW